LSSLKHNNLILELENKVIMEFKQVLYGIRLWNNFVYYWDL